MKRQGGSVRRDPLGRLRDLSKKASDLYKKHGVTPRPPTRVDDPAIEEGMKRMREKLEK